MVSFFVTVHSVHDKMLSIQDSNSFLDLHTRYVGLDYHKVEQRDVILSGFCGQNLKKV